MGIQKHHVIPLSLWWLEIIENKLELEDKYHKLVHAILNINSRKIRDLKKKINDLDTPLEDVSRIEAKLIKEYMKNLEDLPEDIKIKTINSLIWQIQRLKYEIKKRTIIITK